ncbi:MAG: NTPase [Candidatus Hermodarchaeota archaeon]
MAHKIVITGSPGCGKSTLIRRLIEFTSKEQRFTIRGFITPEVREHNRRIGFDIEDITTGSKIPFARVGNFNSEKKVGKYTVYIDELDLYISKLERFVEDPSTVFIIDEIGKMELFSNKFETFIKKLFTNNHNIVATMGQTLHHPIKDYIRKVTNIRFFLLTRENQHQIFEKVKMIIVKQF